MDNVDGIVSVSTKTNPDNTISCSFRRPITPTDANRDYLYDMSKSLLGVLSYGGGLQGVRPTYHGRNQYASAQIDFLATEAVVSQAVPLDGKLKAHGILMIIAWMLLATCGIFMPRYMKPVLKDRKICGKAAWFPIHQVTMLSCVVTFIAGFVMILVHFKGKWADEADRHHWLGLFTIISGLIQPVMAAFRPAPNTEKRPIFNWAHRLMGVLAWVLGGFAIIYGMDITGQDDTAAIVFVVAIIALFLLLDFTLVSTKGKRSSAPISFASPDQQVRGVEQQQVNKNEGTIIQWVFLTLVFGLSIAMTAYHIYTIATIEVGASN